MLLLLELKIVFGILGDGYLLTLLLDFFLILLNLFLILHRRLTQACRFEILHEFSKCFVALSAILAKIRQSILQHFFVVERIVICVFAVLIRIKYYGSVGAENEVCDFLRGNNSLYHIIIVINMSVSDMHISTLKQVFCKVAHKIISRMITVFLIHRFAMLICTAPNTYKNTLCLVRQTIFTDIRLFFQDIHNLRIDGFFQIRIARSIVVLVFVAGFIKLLIKRLLFRNETHELIVNIRSCRIRLLADGFNSRFQLVLIYKSSSKNGVIGILGEVGISVFCIFAAGCYGGKLIEHEIGDILSQYPSIRLSDIRNSFCTVSEDIQAVVRYSESGGCAFSQHHFLSFWGFCFIKLIPSTRRQFTTNEVIINLDCDV